MHQTLRFRFGTFYQALLTSPWHRVLLAVVGGYALTVGIAGLVALMLAQVMPRSEAVVLMCMLAFVLYLVILLWSFTERRLWRLWLTLAGGALASHGVSLWLATVAPATGPAAGG